MNSKDRLFKYFLAWLLLFALVIIGIWMMPVLDNATGSTHPEFSTMLHSGTSVAAESTTKLVALAYGIGIIGILTFAILIATRKSNPAIQKAIHRRIIIGGILYVLVYALMVNSYWNYSISGDAVYFLGFPAPTAWMLFGMWGVPLFFTFFYIFKFDSWVISPEEEERFHEIVRERQSRTQS